MTARRRRQRLERRERQGHSAPPTDPDEDPHARPHRAPTVSLLPPTSAPASIPRFRRRLASLACGSAASWAVLDRRGSRRSGHSLSHSDPGVFFPFTKHFGKAVLTTVSLRGSGTRCIRLGCGGCGPCPPLADSQALPAAWAAEPSGDRPAAAPAGRRRHPSPRPRAASR